MQVIDGPENRIVFIGMDQARDELLYSDVKGKNPFKDVRVRKAFYQAVDIDLIKSRLMAGQAVPTGAMVPSPKASLRRCRAREAPALRPRGREEADGRGRLPRTASR